MSTRACGISISGGKATLVILDGNRDDLKVKNGACHMSLWVIERILNDELKTNAKLKDIYGLSPQGIFQLIQDNWLASLIG